MNHSRWPRVRATRRATSARGPDRNYGWRPRQIEGLSLSLAAFVSQRHNGAEVLARRDGSTPATRARVPAQDPAFRSRRCECCLAQCAGRALVCYRRACAARRGERLARRRRARAAVRFVGGGIFRR
eukprot:TRINITY_DN18687_c0_g1_i1.p2 TRINITY_DN18687_c0_g1~~TRINITY_DN18687_c0_g1_i1.p2  ORF type:complete len:127 (+),score=5.53 TRINITY_DN18687_c0_g1_i1:30-410(+)